MHLRLFSVLLPEVALLTCAHSVKPQHDPVPVSALRTGTAEFVEWKPVLPEGKPVPERDVKVQNKFTRNFFVRISFFFLVPEQSGRKRSLRESAYTENFCTT